MQSQELSSRLAPIYEATDLPDALPAGAHRRRRRRWIATGAIVAGTFVLVIAALLPLYVYPRMAVLPEDPQNGTMLIASGATILAPSASAPLGASVLTNANVTIETFVSGVPGGPGRNSVVWQIATQTFVAGHGLVNAQAERISFDRRTAQPTNCCGDRLLTSASDTEGRALAHRGYVTWPFNIQQHSYQLWDLNIENTKTAEFTGVETRNGIRTYRFQSVVPRRAVGTMDLPGAFFGKSDVPSVPATTQYADVSTYWVEPATGAVISVRDEITREFTYAGRTVTAFAGTLNSADYSAAQLSQLRRGAMFLPLVRGQATVELVGLGVGLLVFGLWLGSARPRRGGGHRSSLSWR